MGINLETSERFLDYHDDNIVGAYETLEKGDIAAISEVDQGLIYEFRLHRAFFDYAGIFALSSFLLLKIGSVVGVQIAIMKNIVSRGVENLFQYNQPLLETTPQDEFLIQAVQENLDTTIGTEPTQQPILSEEASMIQDKTGEIIGNEEKTFFEETNDVAQIERDTVTNETKRQEFIKRQYATPTLGKIMLIVGIVVIVAGVAQMLVDNLYTVIPADKAGVIQQMQAEL
jgi:hypothetical protein